MPLCGPSNPYLANQDQLPLQDQLLTADPILKETLEILKQASNFRQTKFNQDCYIHPLTEVRAVMTNKGNQQILQQAFIKTRELVTVFTQYLDFKRTLMKQLYEICTKIVYKSNSKFTYNSNLNYVLLNREDILDYIIVLTQILQQFIDFNQQITILQPANDIVNFKKYDKMLKNREDQNIAKGSYSPLIEYLMTNVESQYETLGCYPTFERIWQEPEWNEQVFKLMIELSIMLAMKYNLYNESQTMLCIANSYIQKCQHKSILDKSITGLKLSELIKFLKKHNYTDMLEYFLFNDQTQTNQIRLDEYKLLK